MLPETYQVQSITHDTHDVFTLALSKLQGTGGMSFLPGQFNMLYQYGFGEVAISISGDPSKNEVLFHTIRAVGSVTHRLQKLRPGNEIGIRGPYGSSWPLENKGGDVLVLAGGVGLAPLRPALYRLAARRKEYNTITLLYGARTPDDICFQPDLEAWRQQGLDIEVTVDNAGITWNGNVGVVTTLIKNHLPRPKNTLCLICGPEIMIKFAVQELMRAPVEPANIHLSLERNMQCAVGFCGHCQFGPYFLCKDGPVFSYSQLKPWLQIKEL